MQEYNDLIENFKKIAKKRWIKSVADDHGGVGNTFEKELGKGKDSIYLPDYEGIEIKCTTRFSKFPLYLFTVAFDGPSFPEINRLIELYGYPDKDFSDKKVLFTKISVLEKNIVKSGYKFQLHINKEKEKLYLKVFNKNNILIEEKSFVYLMSIYNHLVLKLSKMAVIYASKQKIDETDYFRYYKLSLYELISFEKFISLLESGIIIVDLIARINKSGKDIGRYRNKNHVFSIKKDNIESLFKKIYELDYDNK